jgi:uncharacterized protein
MQEIINKLEALVRDMMEKVDESGHDWNHIHRVMQLAITIGKEEGADLSKVAIIALLHDVDDHKFNTDEDVKNQTQAMRLLAELGINNQDKETILTDIAGISYKGAGVADQKLTFEGTVVRDADRLDAMGAVGIARAFSYGGFKQRPFYDEQTPELHQDFDTYRQSTGSTVNHFYEKLLLLKDRMETTTAKRLAQERHEFMERFLERFFKEVGGEG